MPKKVPEFAPLEAPNLLCHGCGNGMRRKIDRFNNGKIQAVTYYCDFCEYGFVSSMPHHNGTMGKYEKPELPKAPIPAEVPKKPVEEVAKPEKAAPTPQGPGGVF